MKDQYEMKLKKVSPHDPEVFQLIEKLNEHNLAHYPPELCHLDPPEVLAKDNCIMIGCYQREAICGIGAVKLFDDYGEIKRMFVSDEYRGRGVATSILHELIEIVKSQKLPYVRLETGKKFAAAVSLYEKHGFKICQPFGQYRFEPHCTCMEMAIES